MNYNRLLQNSRRSNVIGYNIYTMGRNDETLFPMEEKWERPEFGLPGMVSIGHDIEVKDILTLNFLCNGEKQTFSVIRNCWTPAWMETYYRNEPDQSYYPVSGCLCIKETKCFLSDDTFLGEIELFNDRGEPYEVEASLVLPLKKAGNNIYSVNARIRPASLMKEYILKGYAAAQIEDFSDYIKVIIPANGSVKFRYGFSFEPSDYEKAKERLQAAFSINKPFKEAEDAFNSWMTKNAPCLTTDNMDMLKIYYYRYFVIYRAIHNPSLVIPGHDFRGECVYESPFGGWFGAPVGLPIPLQIEEMKWMRRTDSVYSQIENWCRKAGASQDYIQATPMAVWHLYQNHHDSMLLEVAYESCKAYTFSKYNPLYPDELPVCEGSWRVGAEYQPSFYQHTDPIWDWRHDCQGAAEGYDIAKLYRVDECAILAANLKACAEMARVLKKEEERKLFESCTDRVLERIRSLSWNSEKKFFFDCDYKTEAQCDQVYSYDGFMPMLWNMLGREYDEAFSQLQSGGRFDSSFPIPSVGKDCPMYWFDNCLTGPTESSTLEPHFYSCCWNGPAWPFATSIVLEALGVAAGENNDLRNLWLHLFERYTELHFDYGDRSTPVIVEHYRPTDGMAFSIHADYFHSEWIALFMNYWAGIHVTENTIDFRPATRDAFALENVVIHGKNYRFRQWYEAGEIKCNFTEINIDL